MNIYLAKPFLRHPSENGSLALIVAIFTPFYKWKLMVSLYWPRLYHIFHPKAQKISFTATSNSTYLVLTTTAVITYHRKNINMKKGHILAFSISWKISFLLEAVWVPCLLWTSLGLGGGRRPPFPRTTWKLSPDAESSFSTIRRKTKMKIETLMLNKPPHK